MMYSKRHLPDIEQWSQSNGYNVIPRRARPGLAGLRPHTTGAETWQKPPREAFQRLISAAAERSGNDLKHCKDFYLEVKARIWP